ncbi:MAG: protein kinase, partial [Acidobacteriota bacterium]
MSEGPPNEAHTETLPTASTAGDERTATDRPGAADEVDGAALEAGRRLGRYLILEPAGQGGMGRVYAAYDPKLGRKVALKVLKGRGGRAQASRLLREGRALARLNHPNVLSVYDADEVDG